MSSDTSVKVTVSFSERALEQLRELARRKGVSEAQVLSDALALERVATEARAAGGRVLLERHGKFEEIVPAA